MSQYQAQYLNVSSYFDGNHFAYWKVHMRAFLKSLDECIWNFIGKDWKQPNTFVDAWNKEELNECNWNNKGLHDIFMAVSPEEFKRNSLSEIANEA
jgi:hypothetical protein